MPGTEPIRSAANPLLKRVRALLRGKERDRVVLEGDRLVEDALAGGWELEFALVAASRPERADGLAERGVEVRLVEDELLTRVSSLESSPGLLAVAPIPTQRGLTDLPQDPDALVVVACGVQDPGNLGALARTAEAAGATALVATHGCRPWNEKALRGSMGSLLRLPVIEAAADAAWDALVEAGYRCVLARTRGGESPDAFDWSGRVAIWLTAENGAWPEALEARVETADAITIPLAGAVESLNVTVAGAVLLFAAGRTRERVR